MRKIEKESKARWEMKQQSEEENLLSEMNDLDHVGLLLVLDVLSLDRLVALFSVNEGLVVGEHLGPPLVGVSDGRLSVEEIDLLEREPLGLGNLKGKGSER
jgi:hypothetical protein